MVRGLAGAGRLSSFVLLLHPASKTGIAERHSSHPRCLPLPLCQHCLSLQWHGWGVRAALNPHKMLRQEVRQFVYWQISAENHEPYIHRCSVPCYIRVVTIPMGKVQKIINKQS